MANLVNGRWSATLNLPNRRGVYFVTVRAIDKVGNFSESLFRRILLHP